MVHHREPFESIFAVEHSRFIKLTVFSLQDTPAEAWVNGSSIDKNRDLEFAPLQLIDDEGHLLAGGNQQRGEAYGIGLLVNGSFDNFFGGYLLAKVHHFVAIVAENGLDQVFTNIMHVAVNRGQ